MFDEELDDDLFEEEEDEVIVDTEENDDFFEDDDLYEEEDEEEVIINTDEDNDDFFEEDEDDEEEVIVNTEEDDDNNDLFEEDDDDNDLFEEEEGVEEDEVDSTPLSQGYEEEVSLPILEEEVKQEIKSFTDADFMTLSKTAYTIRQEELIPIKDIAFSEPSKTGRRETITGLVKSIQEMGVCTPIHVLKLKDLDEEELEILQEEGEATPPKYLLIDGLRRTYAALKTGYVDIPAKIWEFKDEDLGQKLAFEIGLWLNRAQKHKWSELWDLYQLLEARSQIKPSMFEFLFQLEPGDALKLKEVMLSEYDEFKQQLLASEKSLEQCYKALMKKRKEEDEMEIADNTGLSDTTEDAEAITDNVQQVNLDDEEVKRLMELNLSGDLVDVSEDDFNELNTEEFIVQDRKKNANSYTDPRNRKAVLIRDNFTCQCCGTGGVAFLDVIVVHHLFPVAYGGPDTINNLICLCQSCHLTLHVAQYNKGRLPMTKEQFDEYSEHEQERIKKILKLGKYAYQASLTTGLTPEEIDKISKAEIVYDKPGIRIQENMSIYKDAKNNTQEVEEAMDKVDGMKDRILKAEAEVKNKLEEED